MYSAPDHFDVEMNVCCSDSPETWLQSESSWPLSQVTSVLPTAWHYGLSVSVQAANTVHFLLGDLRHAPAFLAHMSSVMPATCVVRRVDSDDEATPQPQLVMPLLEQENASHIALATNFLHTMKLGTQLHVT